MEKIKNTSMANRYIQQYNIEKFFNGDIPTYLELILFKKGEHICKEGEETNYLLFFVRGKAKVYTTLKNGKNMLVCFYNPLELIGEVEIIKLVPAISSIQAIEDCYCIGISTKITKENLMKDINFLLLICESLGNKLERLSKNSSINLSYPLENRLASFIIASKTLMKIEDRKIVVFNENLTEVSELLGTSYRHLLRSLKILCEKSIIKKREAYYEIIDYNALLCISSDLYK